ncbi:hypothetical protein BCR43DRAFT_486442 [Syncephalastrum racemosum]|uniref:Uncharacterized protein n=1 Tax=Syncephalastrum racemosum TaxID=13706 RepID=A0A1X2HP56_SYNRA|nr:hypothetical protein BCR43DRAFT_486442 [Syncephalastrum racemosum]
MDQDTLSFDVGRRPARRKRHLPTVEKDTSIPLRNHKKQSDDEDTMSDDGDTRFARKRRPHLEHSFSKQAASSKKSAVVKSLFLVGCAIWAAFLAFRVLSSIWFKDAAKLSVIDFIASKT